jgi:hypothetical protein
VSTPDPKEIAIIPANGGYTVLDYGFSDVVTFDSLFLGHVLGTFAPGQDVTFQILSEFGGGSVYWNSPTLPLQQFEEYPPFHVSYRNAFPVQGKFVRAFIHNSGSVGALQIGLFNVGLSFQPQWGQEYGGGRPIIDTGTATRLIGGGFGIDEGTIVGGYQWQFGDISKAELAKLYALLKTRGNTKPVWVVEDPDQVEGLNEGTHYGLFTKIEPYERLDATRTRYTLQMEEWV